MAAKQLELPTWGGRRKGAGRKRRAPRPMVSHKARPQHSARFPLHAVLRAQDGVPRLREKRVLREIRKGLEAGAARAGFRLVHFSVQGNHIHLIVEATNREALSRGMQGLAIRLARAVNRAAGRKGGVFSDHYFARELKTPTEVRRAVRYVLDNHIVHGKHAPRTDGVRVVSAAGGGPDLAADRGLAAEPGWPVAGQRVGHLRHPRRRLRLPPRVRRPGQLRQ